VGVTKVFIPVTNFCYLAATQVKNSITEVRTNEKAKQVQQKRKTKFHDPWPHGHDLMGSNDDVTEQHLNSDLWAVNSTVTYDIR
jgi:hypothetical protein